MRRSMNLRVAGIRFRIILLSFLGIAGMLIVAGLSKYLDISKTNELAIGIKSQEIARFTLQNMIIEEQFVRSSEKEMPAEYQKLQILIKQITAFIETKSKDEKIQKLTRQIT